MFRPQKTLVANQCGAAQGLVCPAQPAHRPGETTRYGHLVIEAMRARASTAGTAIGELPYYHIDNHNLLPTRLRFGVRAGFRTGEAGRGHTHAHSWVTLLAFSLGDQYGCA
jgi:hypothetical protein